jgi:hypothetical protein
MVDGIVYGVIRPPYHGKYNSIKVFLKKETEDTITYDLYNEDGKEKKVWSSHYYFWCNF